MNLSILPEEAILELKKYYEYLVWKYKSLSQSIHDNTSEDASEKLNEAFYKPIKVEKYLTFNREEIYER